MLVFFGIANVFMGFIALNVSTSLRVAYGCWVGFMILVYMLYQPMKTVRQSFLAHSRRRARNSFYLYPSSSLALSLSPPPPPFSYPPSFCAIPPLSTLPAQTHSILRAFECKCLCTYLGRLQDFQRGKKPKRKVFGRIGSRVALGGVTIASSIDHPHGVGSLEIEMTSRHAVAPEENDYGFSAEEPERNDTPQQEVVPPSLPATSSRGLLSIVGSHSVLRWCSFVLMEILSCCWQRSNVKTQCSTAAPCALSVTNGSAQSSKR